MGSEPRFEVVVADLGGHPQGPDVLPDGRFVCAETITGRLVAFEAGGEMQTFADLGGGPIGCVVGSDRRAYVAQNGGRIGFDLWVSERPTAPSIQRCSVDGAESEVLCTEVDSVPLCAPHDVAWGADGRLYFTDSGRWDPEQRRDSGYVYALGPDGSAERVLELGPVFPCGIAGEPDGSIVWTEGYTGRIGRRRPDGTVETVAELPGEHVLEGVRIAADGSILVTAFDGGGIHVLSADGERREFLELPAGSHPMNLILGDGTLWVIDLAGEGEDMQGQMLAGPVDRRAADPLRGELP